MASRPRSFCRPTCCVTKTYIVRPSRGAGASKLPVRLGSKPNNGPRGPGCGRLLAMHMMREEAAISGGSVMQKASILSIIRTSMLSIVIVALSVPAFANDADLKKQLEQMGGT